MFTSIRAHPRVTNNDIDPIGYSYTFYNEGIKQWGEDNNLTEFSGSQASVHQPLVREPNTEFNYGVNIDWAGIAVERVTGMSLGAYCKEIIFDPLGLKDTAFEAPAGEHLTRFASLHTRNADETLTPREHFEFSTSQFGLSFPSPPFFFGRIDRSSLTKSLRVI